MRTVREFHAAALRAIDASDLARRAGMDEEAENHLRAALEAEAEAAMQLVASDAEPARSILFRSAATIALRLREFDRAERLAAFGLTGKPSPALGEELRAVIKDASFVRWQQTIAMRVPPEALDVAIDGDGIGYGVAPYAVVSRMLEAFKRLVPRNQERLIGLPFAMGKPKATTARTAQQFVEAPERSSFRFRLRYSDPKINELPGLSLVGSNLDDIVNGFHALERHGVAGLMHRIGNEAYANNFLALAREIFPDGSNIRAVQISTSNVTSPNSVIVRTHRSGLVLEPSVRDPSTTIEEITGEFGEAKKFQSCLIGIKSDAGRIEHVQVPKELLADIIAPLWGKRVRVSCAVSTTKSGKRKFTYRSHELVESN